VPRRTGGHLLNHKEQALLQPFFIVQRRGEANRNSKNIICRAAEKQSTDFFVTISEFSFSTPVERELPLTPVWAYKGVDGEALSPRWR